MDYIPTQHSQPKNYLQNQCQTTPHNGHHHQAPSALLLRRPTCLASWALPPPTCPHDGAQTEGKGFTQEVRPTWPITLDPVTDLWGSLPAHPAPH